MEIHGVWIVMRGISILEGDDVYVLTCFGFGIVRRYGNGSRHHGALYRGLILNVHTELRRALFRETCASAICNNLQYGETLQHKPILLK